MTDEAISLVLGVVVTAIVTLVVGARVLDRLAPLDRAWVLVWALYVSAVTVAVAASLFAFYLSDVHTSFERIAALAGYMFMAGLVRYLWKMVA
jgi:hypothetical protein